MGGHGQEMWGWVVSFLIDSLAYVYHPRPLGQVKEGGLCRHQAQAGGHALSIACACSLASNRKDVSSRVKPSMKAEPRA